MLKNFFHITLCAMCLSSCTFFVSDKGASEVLLSKDTLPAEQVLISVELKEHQAALDLVVHENLDSADVDTLRLEAWWDSLPNQIQEKIRDHRLDVELIATVNAPVDSIDPIEAKTIKQAGQVLKDIIGEASSLTLTVNTKVDPNAYTTDEDESTIIKLREHVAVSLSTYDLSVFLRSNHFSNDNMLTLQYWWHNLPEEIKEQIRKREILVDLNAVNLLSDMDGAIPSGMSVENNLSIFKHNLNKIIGTYPAMNIVIPVASLKSEITHRQLSEQELSFPSRQFVKVTLRKASDLDQTAF